MAENTTTTKEISANIIPKLHSKFTYICSRNNKSVDEQLADIIKNYVYDYELKNGVISPLDLIKNARKK